jgi:DNA-binding IclR family transcriptional regulator
MVQALALRAPSARALREALASQGAAKAADLARALGLSEATASVQLRRLQDAGLAQKGPDGRWAAA